MNKNIIVPFICFLILSFNGLAQRDVRVVPKEIDSVLTNPGIGFTTFQRFNGDTLNAGFNWTEGFPIVYQDSDGKTPAKNFPMTSIAYFRIYWKYLEPEDGVYDWSVIDKAMKVAHDRGQTLMVRIAPHGMVFPHTTIGDEEDVPDWYRKIVGNKDGWAPMDKNWRINPNDPNYAHYFGRMIAAFGDRYDGHPYLESVDLAVVGAWGEGAGMDQVSMDRRKEIVRAYTDHFKQTPLKILLTMEDSDLPKYALSQADVGWRVDCLGEMYEEWSHMKDFYPQSIIESGMQDAWKKAPVSFEVCWVMKDWEKNGWDIDYIIDQSLKWHLSSVNAKSSAVPEKWTPQVNRWLKSMGYRFVLRKFTYPEFIGENRMLSFTSWWENKGVAPIYKKDFRLAIRLKNEQNSVIRTTDADITNWLPGDNLYNSSIFIPDKLPKGTYFLEIGIVDKDTKAPKVALAIEGRTDGGWYRLGKVELK